MGVSSATRPDRDSSMPRARPHDRGLMQRIFHPLSTGYMTTSFGTYLSKLSEERHEWMPSQAKNLLDEAAFVESRAELQVAFRGLKKHIVWNPTPHLLFAWEREVKGTWSLKVFFNPPQQPSLIRGSLLTLASIFAGGAINSQWTSDAKTRIDPIALAYKGLSASAFSDEWLGALDGEDWSTLFSPLEKYRVSAPKLPKADDRAGLMKRFMTTARGGQKNWWLYKAWLRHFLPKEEYKKFHFFHRFTLLNEYEEGVLDREKPLFQEAASKLMRALSKRGFALAPRTRNEVQERLQALSRRTPSPVVPARARDVMPPEHIEQVSPVSAAERPAAASASHSFVERVMPFQWHRMRRAEPPRVDGEALIAQVERCLSAERLDKVMELAQEHHLLDRCADRSVLRKYQNLAIFKRLVACVNVDLAESLSLTPKQDALAHRVWENPEHYQEWLKLYEELIPKKDLFIQCMVGPWHKLPKNKVLARFLLCTLEGKPESELPKDYDRLFKYFVRDPRGRIGSDHPLLPAVTKLREDFPRAYAFLCGVTSDRSGRDSDHGVSSTLYLAESIVNRKEAFEPFDSSARVLTHTVLPFSAPLQALVNYEALNPFRKFGHGVRGDYDLFEAFFQEAFLSEELAKEGEALDRGMNRYVKIDPKLLKRAMQARLKGSLPWAEALKDAQFRAVLENFLESELATFKQKLEQEQKDVRDYPYPFLALLRLSALCVRVCPELKIPDFAECCRGEIPESVRLYLFWLHAEAGKPTEEWRSLSNTLRSIPVWWEGLDEERILYHLQRLPDLPAVARRVERRWPGIALEEAEAPPAPTEIDPSVMTHTLEAKWGSGEAVVLTQPLSPTSLYAEDQWKLQDRPHLFWRRAPQGVLHGNELVDAENQVVAHIFHVEGICFEIALDADGGLSPSTLEEQLCLLLHYCKAHDLKKQWALIQRLPLITHKLSPVALKLMEQIAQMALQGSRDQFDRLGLSMQIVQRFQEWTANPALQLPAAEKDPLIGVCIALWEQYRNLEQNISQEYVLTPLQRRHLSALLPNQAKAKLADSIPALVNGLPLPKKVADFMTARLLNHLKKTEVTSHHSAWKRTVKMTTFDTAPLFFQTDQEILYGKYPINYDRFHRYLASLCVRIACVFARFCGSRHVWAERVVQLETDAARIARFIPTRALTPEEKVQMRLKLAAEKRGGVNYCCEMMDWALDQGIYAWPHETPAGFIARVEQLKHVKSLAHKLAPTAIYNFVARMTGWIAVVVGHIAWKMHPVCKKAYTCSPTAVTPTQADQVREPFELRHHRNSRVSAADPRPSVAISKEEILEKANRLTAVSPCVAARVQQPVEWGHLEGLFVQDGMIHLSGINPALTREECREIDSLMHAYFSARSNPEYAAYDRSQKDLVTRGLLVFEHITGMEVRLQQVKKLKTLLSRTATGRYTNLAMQMEMGGGKTSVLASIALAQAAQPGRISIFIPPAAQYETLANMLTKWQKQRFQQEVIPIDLSFALLQEESTLLWLQERLVQAKERGHVLLIHPSTLHNLRLAWLSCKDPQQLKMLFAIRKELKENGDALIDEVDQILDPFKDTSMAYGEAKQPAMRHLKAFKDLMCLHARDEQLWKALCANAPQEIDMNKYKLFQKEVIAPVYARKFKIPSELCSSFNRYLVGEATQEHDALFLKWLSTSTERDAIAQHKHWLEDILRFTCLRERDRHYGRKDPSSEVVPYIGVGAPGNTKFSQLGEEISYYWLTALSSPLDQNKFDEIVEMFKLRFNRCAGNQVMRAKICAEFAKVTGGSLTAILGATPRERKERIREVLAGVNADPFKKLECEVYFAHKHVRYFEAQLTSTSQDFLSLFSTHRGFSGTFPGYIHAFDHTVVADPESDASVIRAMKRHGEPIEEVEEMSTLFTRFAETPDMGGLIDSGGLFRGFRNEQIAERILTQLPHIQSIVFFGKKAETDLTPDTPMLMTRLSSGGFRQRALSSPEAHVLKGWGVDPQSLFVEYDQRHCEATDVAQLPGRVNALTFGLRTTQRDLLQGVMRLRKYKESEGHQKVVFVMQPKTKEKLFGDQELTVELLLQKSKEIEAEETERRTFRTFYHRIDAAFCTTVEEYIETHGNHPKRCERLRAFLLHHVTHPSAYTQFGGITVERTSRQMLQDYLAERRKAFAAVYPGSLPKSLLKQLGEIEKLLANFSEKKVSSKQGVLGQEQQQEVQQEQQQEQQQERVLPTPPTGRSWSEVPEFRTVNLADHYSSRWSRRSLVSRSFDAKLFSGLYASENFVHTYQTAYALNHPDQKRANYVLLARSREGKLVATILSSYDYHMYHTGKRKVPEGMAICWWLPSQEGATQYLKGTLRLTDTDKAEWNKVRLQIAFLNGNVSYIVDHQEDLGEPITDQHCAFLRKRVEYWQHPYHRENPERDEALQLIGLLEQP